jgi:hypothetical protein
MLTGHQNRPRASDFADVLLMERASLARPILSAWQRRTWGYVGQAVLVLDKWGWGRGVLDYCAKSELHPATAGLELLKGRQMIRPEMWFSLWLCNTASAAPGLSRALGRASPTASASRGRVFALQRYLHINIVILEDHGKGLHRFYRRRG